MVRIENIESKISSLRAYLKKLSRYQAMTIEDIIADQDLQGATERYLYLAAQATIDIAEMTCKLKKLKKPESMAEAFDLLCKASILERDMAEILMRMVGFRNALSHGYENLNYEIIADVLNKRLCDLENFASIIEQNL